MEAYKVWVTLNLRGDAHKKMQLFNKLVNKTNVEIAKLMTYLSKFSMHFNNLSNIFGTINPEVKIYNINIKQSTNVMNNATYSANRYAVALTRINASIRNGGGGGGRNGGHGGFISGAGAAIGASHIGRLGAAAGGYAIASTVMKAYHSGSEFQKEMGLLQGQNIPGLDRSAINKFLNNTRVPGASRLDLLEALSDAAVITKGKNEAIGVAETLAKMKVVGSGYGKESFRMTPRQLQAAIKTAEIVSGSRNPQVLNEHLGMMMQTWISTQGRVEPTQYQGVVRSARGYAAGMDPKFFYYMLEPMIQEFGTRTGPMISQFYQHMKVGRLSTQGAQILGSLGLVNPGAVDLNRAGMIKGIKPGGISGMDVAGKNIFQWIDKFLTPAMQKGGYKTKEDQLGILGKIFTNSDLTLVLTYLTQREKFLASAKVNENTSALDKMLKDLSGLHSGKMQQFSAGFTNFVMALDKLTGPMIDAALAGLGDIFNILSIGMNKISSFLPDSPMGNQSLSDMLKNSGQYSLPGFGNITSSRSSGSSSANVSDVYLDSTKVGKIIFSKASNIFNSNVSQGTSQVNTLSSPIMPGLNYGSVF